MSSVGLARCCPLLDSDSLRLFPLGLDLGRSIGLLVLVLLILEGLIQMLSVEPLIMKSERVFALLGSPFL